MSENLKNQIILNSRLNISNILYVVMAIQRKRNVDLTKIPGLGKIQDEGVLSNLPTVNDSSSITPIQEDNSDRKFKRYRGRKLICFQIHLKLHRPVKKNKYGNHFQHHRHPNKYHLQIYRVIMKVWLDFLLRIEKKLFLGTPKTNAEKTTKKLSFAEYRKRNEEKKRKEKEEKAKREAEIKKQEESRLSGDQLSAVLT